MWKAIAARGLLGICLPVEHGGEARPVIEAVAAFEGLSHGCLDSGVAYAATSQVFGIQMPLVLMASAELNQTYLPGIIAGDISVAHAFTEEGGGSDAFSMDTAATKDGDHWILTGTKTFVTNAPRADLALVFARTGEGRSPFALTAFLVDMTWAGASYGRVFDKIGLRTVGMGELCFDAVRVPRSHAVSRAGDGLRVLTESTGWERALLLTSALGPMRRVLDQVIDRARNREQFGRPIGSFQQVSAKVADMVWRYKVSRMLIYEIAARLENGLSTNPLMQDTAIVKLFVSENYQQFMLDAVQIFGVRGILYDWPIQQAFRDSIPSTIYAGTSESLRNTIAKLAGLAVE